MVVCVSVLGGNAGSLGYPTTESEVALMRWVLTEGRAFTLTRVSLVSALLVTP